MSDKKKPSNKAMKKVGVKKKLVNAVYFGQKSVR